MGSAEDELEEAIEKGQKVRVEVADAVCGEDAVDHLPRAGRQVARRRSKWAEHQRVQQRKKVRLTARKTEEEKLTARKTEEEKPKQAGCLR